MNSLRWDLKMSGLEFLTLWLRNGRVYRFASLRLLCHLHYEFHIGSLSVVTNASSAIFLFLHSVSTIIYYLKTARVHVLPFTTDWIHTNLILISKIIAPVSNFKVQVYNHGVQSSFMQFAARSTVIFLVKKYCLVSSN